MTHAFSRLRPVLVALVTIAIAACPCAVRAQEPETTAQVDESIARALAFISQAQQESGAWTTDSFGDSTATTSLAVMAFLSAGYLPDEGPYGEQMTKGIRWVIEHQEPSGILVHRRSHGPMYSHGISTLMLAEVVGVVNASMEPAVHTALEKAIKLMLDSQSLDKQPRHAGGWRYQINSRDSDLSVTGWQVLALRAAKDVGCDVPAEAIDDAVRYIRACSTPDRRGFGYQPGHGATPTLTGVGILALEVCGEHRSDESLGGADYLVQRPLRFDDSYFFYGVYYTGVGMFKLGAEHATQGRNSLLKELLPNQQADGSWLSKHGQERRIGKVYATSLAVLALAVEYRYLPIYQR